MSRAVGSCDSCSSLAPCQCQPLRPLPAPLGIFLVCPGILVSTLRQGYLGAKAQRPGILPRKEEANGGGGVEGRVDSQRRKEAERQMDREGQRDVGERSRREGA